MGYECERSDETSASCGCKSWTVVEEHDFWGGRESYTQIYRCPEHEKIRRQELEEKRLLEAAKEEQLLMEIKRGEKFRCSRCQQVVARDEWCFFKNGKPMKQCPKCRLRRNREKFDVNRYFPDSPYYDREYAERYRRQQDFLS